MTNDNTNDMIKEKLKQLIQDSITSNKDDSDDVYAIDYNFTEPNVFNNNQKETLIKFISVLTDNISINLNSFLKAQTDIELNETSTHFAQRLIAQLNESGDNRTSIEFSDGKNSCGIVTMTKVNAVELLKPILGVMEEEELSLLEISLLEDIFTIVLDSLKQCHQTMNFRVIDNMASGKISHKLEPTLEVFKISLSITDSIIDLNAKLDVIIDCSKLFPIVGKTITNTDFGKQQVQDALIECFDNTNVTLSCHCAAQDLTVKQIMSLQPEDIVVFDKSANEPFVIKMDQRPLFNARPCASKGFYAAVLTEPIITTDSLITE